MNRKGIIIGLLLGLIFSLAQCKDEPTVVPAATIFGTPYQLEIPFGFPNPNIPADNPMTEEAVALGRFLFYEKSLSADNTMSCSSCHMQERAFTDETPTSVGVKGLNGRRKSMPIFNLAFHDKFFWDGRVLTLEEQSIHPILDTLEFDNDVQTVIDRLEADPKYPVLFAAAFGDDAITEKRIGKAIAQFERTIISANSKFDRVLYRLGAKRL
jgi:cytochrome c peroxidase